MQEVNPLPPGWDCKLINNKSRYYINYFTRNTTMEDPRVKNESIPLQDFSTNSRLGLKMGTNCLKRQQSEVPATTDQTVAKISSMFPTVSETHIRSLLLKYLKSVFPVVEETVLLDTLSSSDDNVHRATQALQTMGFGKKCTSTSPPRVCLQRDTSVSPQPHTTPHIKSYEEKQKIKVRLMGRHPHVEGRVVSLALDSVEYDEERADMLLILAAETAENDNVCIADSGVGEETFNEALFIEEPQQANSPECPPPGLTVEDVDRDSRPEYKPSRISLALGPDPSLRRGPNQALLIPNCLVWRSSGKLSKGANREIYHGPAHAHGPDPSLRSGPDRTLARGSQVALRCK